MTPMADRKSSGVSSLSVLVVTALKNSPDFWAFASAAGACALARTDRKAPVKHPSVIPATASGSLFEQDFIRLRFSFMPDSRRKQYSPALAMLSNSRSRRFPRNNEHERVFSPKTLRQNSAKAPRRRAAPPACVSVIVERIASMRNGAIWHRGCSLQSEVEREVKRGPDEAGRLEVPGGAL